MRTPRLYIQEGCIKVNSAVVRQAPGVLIASIDHPQKYAEVGTVCDDGTVIVGPTERTLYLDGDNRTPTVLRLKLRGDWRVRADTGRYTTTIIAVRMPKTAWRVMTEVRQRPNEIEVK